ncbi:MAG: ATP-dependent helicase [Clostridium sp.]|nr:ATP-dependent helicase [Clostridium sp.]
MSEVDIKNDFFNLRDKIIENKYNCLDSAQKKSVFFRDKNGIVIACPGAGKTQVIINRVNYLCTFGPVYGTNMISGRVLKEDIDSMKRYLEDSKNTLSSNSINLLTNYRVKGQNIFVITFTKAAAINMKNRYKSLFQNENGVFFGTFHGLFYKILKRYVRNINIIESYMSYRIIKNVLTAYMDEIGDDKLREIISDISKFKTSMCEMAEYNPCVEKEIFEKCYKAYEDYKSEKDLMDFDDLQINCYKLFKENSGLLSGYSRLFKFMLVDEFQDCDALQIDILKLLNENSSLYAVGDEDQCIYGFRGSRPDCMVGFSSIFKDGKKMYLSTNYRSVENIVNISKNLIKNNKIRNDKNILAKKQQLGNINIINSLNENDEASRVYENIIKNKEINEYEFSDFAVLYRTNVESRSIIDSFIRKKIPFRLLDREYNFFEHFICKDIISYLKLSIDKTDKESFLRIINKPFRYISKLNLQSVKNHMYSEDMFEVLKDVNDIPVFQMKNIDKLKKNIQSLNKMSLPSAIQYVLSTIGYYDYIMEYARKFKIDMDDLSEIIEEFKKSAEGYKTIITFLAHVEEVSEEIKNSKKSLNSNAVILSTIHGVKGMEFKNVFIINCCEENIPHKNSIEKNLEEERRLFYVGITRAIDNLWLCISRDIRGKSKEPSRFVKECGLEFKSFYAGKYKVGEKVRHSSFGVGKITELSSDVVEIEFEGGIKRKFDPVVLGNNSLIDKVD